jgi:hypothetical protein
MDMYDEELRARFIAGTDAAIMLLEGAVGRLRDARAAAVANKPKEAFDAYQTTMDVLKDFIEQSKKEPKPRF